MLGLFQKEVLNYLRNNRYLEPVFICHLWSQPFAKATRSFNSVMIILYLFSEVKLMTQPPSDTAARLLNHSAIVNVHSVLLWGCAAGLLLPLGLPMSCRSVLSYWKDSKEKISMRRASLLKQTYRGRKVMTEMLGQRQIMYKNTRPKLYMSISWSLIMCFPCC